MGLGVAVAMVIATLGGCGTSASPTQRASAEARTACVDLFELGANVTAGTSILTTTATKALDAAHTDADDAFVLEHHQWAQLAGTVREIRSALLFDRRAELNPELDDLTVECRPLLPSG